MGATVVNVDDEKLASEALERVKEQLSALPPERLLQVNLDVQAAEATILGALPKLRAFRERVKELPGFDIVAFDCLEDYVLALSSAQATFQTATLPPDNLEPLAAEGQSLRALLLAEARALSLRGVIDAHQLDHLKGATSRSNIAQDLQMLSMILLDSWPQMQGKTPTTQEDLLLASRISTRLMRLVGARAHGATAVASATDQRQRAFTLLLRTYEEARAAIGYLRRHEADVDSIAPSLYPGKGKRRAHRDAQVPTGAQSTATGQPSTSLAEPASPDQTETQAGSSGSAAAAEGTARNGQAATKHPFLS